MDRCRYPSKPCHNPRALKLNGELHRFCEQHRRQANQNQMRWSKRKQTVRSRRGDGEEDDHARRSDEGESEDYATGGRVNAPPLPSSAAATNMGSSLAVNVSAAGASLSHMSINNGHPAAHAGLISSYQDHLARGAPMPGANNVNNMMMARSPMMAGMMERGRSTHMMVQPPMHQNPLPPILPPRDAPRVATEQPDPAVHALLMLERAANVVTMTQQPEVEPANDDDVRRDLKRAKSNEWMPRPTLSPAGLPAVAALVNNPASSIASSGRSASWQPTVHHESRESLGQWMQRKQASLPSISNLPRIEKRPYESISSSAPPPPAPSAASSTTASVSPGYPHRGMEPANARGGPYMPHPQHPPVPETHTNVKVESSATASATRAAYV